MDLQKFSDVFRRINKYDETNGLEFKIHSPGSITYRMTIKEQHLSSPGNSHGAAIAGMMDCVLGLSALSQALTEDNLVATVEFKINYLKPVLLSDELTGTGKVVHKGKSLLISSGEIRNQKGDLVALGQGTFNSYPSNKKDFFNDIK